MKINKKDIITIILARGGSKGLKNKNLRKLNGKPLIYYPIKAAFKSKYIGNIIISTDQKKLHQWQKNMVPRFHLYDLKNFGH